MNNKNGLSGADGVRAIACLMVIFHHVAQRLYMYHQTGWGLELLKLFLIGNSGVSFFFVLSGFLLAFPFWKRYLEGGEFPGVKEYAVRRAARIMPGYYTALIISSILGVLYLPDLRHIFLKFLTGMTFTSGFHYFTLFPAEIDSPLWSISFEVFCYVLLPVFMGIMFFYTGKKRSFQKALLFWIGSEIFVLAVNGLVHVFFTPDSVQRGWEFGNIGGSKWWMPNYNPVGFFAHFSLGILASGFTVRLSKQSALKDRLYNKGFFDIASMIFLVSIVLFLWNVRSEEEFSVGFQGQPFYFPFLTILIAGLLVTLAHSRFMGGWLDNRFFRFTAKISFGLYIWHFIIIFLIRFYFVNTYYENGMREWAPWLATSLVMIALSYLVAAASYYFLEKPFMDRAHKRLKEPKPEYRFRAKIRLRPVIATVLICLLALVFLYPLIWLFDASFRPQMEMLRNPPVMFQKPVWESVLSYTRDSYLASFVIYNAGAHLMNSVIITSSVIVLTLVISSFFAYALVFIKVPWNNFFFILAVSTMMVPVNTLIVSVFKVYLDLHLYNTWIGLILQASVSGFGVFLLRQYFIKIPYAFIESAQMDGAGHLQIWWHIIMPMARPALAALAIIQFRIVWNDFLLPAIILRDGSLATLPVLLLGMSSGGGGSGLSGINTAGAWLATGFISVIIPLILFLRFHKQFIEGFTGSMKG